MFRVCSEATGEHLHDQLDKVKYGSKGCPHLMTDCWCKILWLLLLLLLLLVLHFQDCISDPFRRVFYIDCDCILAIIGLPFHFDLKKLILKVVAKFLILWRETLAIGVICKIELVSFVDLLAIRIFMIIFLIRNYFIQRLKIIRSLYFLD